MAFKDEVGSLDRIATAVENLSGGGGSAGGGSGDGSGGGSVEIIEASYTDGGGTILSKTAKEISDLMKSGKLVFARCHQEDDSLDSYLDYHIGSMLKYKNSPLRVFAANSPVERSIVEFIAVTDNDYPTTDFTPPDITPGEDRSGEGSGGDK